MTESRFTDAELRRVTAYGKCHEEVSRKGHAQPCDTPAVAVRLDPEDYRPYPVCAYHTRAPMVTLAEIVAAITEADR